MSNTNKEPMQLPLWFQDDYLAKYWQACGIDADFREEMLHLRNQLLCDNELFLALTESVRRIEFKELSYEEVAQNQLLRQKSTELQGIFCLMLVLSGLPDMLWKYSAQKWPIAIYESVIKDIGVWVRHHKRNYGSVGIHPDILLWFNHHLNLNLVAFGRLQFNVKSFFKGGIKAFRNRLSGENVFLVDRVLRFTSSGLPDDVHADPSPDSWLSSFTETCDFWQGNPVDQYGLVGSTVRVLNKSEWELVLTEGDPVLNLHIPENGPLVAEDCLLSLNQAVEFFDKYLPEYRWKSFACTSWLLDPQLEDVLSESSNIRKFRKLGQLLPAPGQADTIFRCFGVSGIDENKKYNSLQQKLVDFVKKGNIFHYGRFVILRNQIPDMK